MIITPNESKTPQTRRICFVAFPGAEILDITGPFEVFAFANYGLNRNGITQEQAYQLDILAEQAGSVKSMSSLQIVATHAYADFNDKIDTLFIPGGDMREGLNDSALIDWINRTAPTVNRLASVCSGAFLLAKCGLLDNRRATTHWDFCAQLQRDYPTIKLEADKIFIQDHNIYTSGGITSGIDLALSMVAKDWGQELALFVARYLVVFLQRPGGQSQFSAYLLSASSNREDFQKLKAWIIEHPKADLRIEALASRMSMSPRNFARQFVTETGMTPAKFVELARLDAARHYLTCSDLSIELVADKVGFCDTERMRRTFMRQLGVNPQSYRSRFSSPAVNKIDANAVIQA